MALRRLHALAIAGLILALPGTTAGQSRPPPAESPDSAMVLDRARAAQAGFERRRARLLPFASGTFGGSCDEVVGRFCSWFSEGEWIPAPEVPAIVAQRRELIEVLDEAHTRIPGDSWILGQRVWYRAEAGSWADALAVARACGQPPSGVWWCAALEGLALHGRGRYREADVVFARALDHMEVERADAWRRPKRALDGRAEDRLEDAPADSLAAALDRLWALADPLFLADGNDRRTAHYARWAVATLRAEARNPFQLSWGRDLEELTVRNGWELGWEQEWSRDLAARPRVVGHKHPQGRDYMPPGHVLEDPGRAAPEDLAADRTRPRSLYAPDYAPVLLPMEGQVVVFPRGDSMVVVATTFLPEDTTLHADHDHRRPWMDAGEQAGEPDRGGLFLLPVKAAGDARRVTWGATEGTGVIAAPAGGYVVSAEAWSPARRRAGRQRLGVTVDSMPPDVPTLSGLLLVRPEAGDPPSLEAAAAGALPRAALEPGQALGVVWEVGGVGWRAERLRYSVSLERARTGLLRRIGGWLGLVGEDPALSVAWEEAAPEQPGRTLRRVVLEPSQATPGTYRVLLRLRISGRDSMTSESLVRILPADASAR